MVGLEIKRELVIGEFARARDAVMPVIAAVGGMVVPALLYTSLNLSGPGRDGWGIPLATDIAFVLGALALLGGRAPTGLRLFLLAVAIVDDLGAILIIAVFYSHGIKFWAISVAVVVFVLIVAMRKLGVARPIAYVVPAIALWAMLHESGLHATLAGVALGLATPARPIRERAVLEELEHRIHPISALAVVPLFALANAGVRVDTDTLRNAASSRISWGIIVGLVVGKTIGITVAVLLARRFRLGHLPVGVTTGALVGGAALAGIGFTVALFIADLSFADQALLAQAKLAVLAASVGAAVVGTVILTAARRRSNERAVQDPGRTVGAGLVAGGQPPPASGISP